MKFANNDAFTLMEIVITLFILGIIVIIFSSFFANSIRLIDASGNKNIALNEARSNINELIAQKTDSQDDSITLIFAEGEADEKIITVNGKLFNETVNYEVIKSDNNVDITYFKAVISE